MCHPMLRTSLQGTAEKKFSNIMIRGSKRDSRADRVETDALTSMDHRKLTSHGEDSTLEKREPISYVAHIHHDRHTFDAVSVMRDENQSRDP